MFLNSSRRKLDLTKWLSDNQPTEFSSNLKLQKFIFLYESFTKLDQEIADFGYMKAYENGPVFSDIYGDYIYRKPDFYATISSMPSDNDVNEDRAKLAGFIVRILTELELSDLTHEFDVWKVKEHLVTAGVKGVTMSESDFSQRDLDLLNTLREMYPIDLIDSVEVLTIGAKSFLISLEDKDKLSEEHETVFISLSGNDELYNPIYVSLSDEGVLLID